MSEIRRVARNELTADEIIDVVEQGGRVVIELSMFGNTREVVIRRHEGVYYCDTPVTLLKHDSPEGLRDCLGKFQLTRHKTVGVAESANTPA